MAAARAKSPQLSTTRAVCPYFAVITLAVAKERRRPWRSGPAAAAAAGQQPASSTPVAAGLSRSITAHTASAPRAGSWLWRALWLWPCVGSGCCCCCCAAGRRPGGRPTERRQALVVALFWAGSETPAETTRLRASPGNAAASSATNTRDWSQAPGPMAVNPGLAENAP